MITSEALLLLSVVHKRFLIDLWEKVHLQELLSSSSWSPLMTSPYCRSEKTACRWKITELPLADYLPLSSTPVSWYRPEPGQKLLQITSCGTVVPQTKSLGWWFYYLNLTWAKCVFSVVMFVLYLMIEARIKTWLINTLLFTECPGPDITIRGPCLEILRYDLFIALLWYIEEHSYMDEAIHVKPKL